MLEILLIIFFSKKIGNKAEAKGYKRGPYIFLLVGLWIFGELTGLVIGGMGNVGLAAYLLALIGAAIGAMSAFLVVDRLEDKSGLDREIDSFGR